MGCKKLQYETKLTVHIGGKTQVGNPLNLSRLPQKSRVETGYYYYGARYYNPKISNWLSVDPLVLEDESLEDEEESGGGLFNTENLSVYAYAHQNPIKYNDPDGRCPTCIVGAVVGAAVDYGIQVGANYLDPEIDNPWTDNISLSSIALSAVEGGLTQGASVGKQLAVKTGVTLINNTVEINTTKGLKVQKNVGNIAKNSLIDGTVGVATKGAGKLAKTSKLDKVAQKLVVSNNKATNVLKKVGMNTKQASSTARKLDVKGVSKQASRGVRNISNKTVENSANTYLKNKVEKEKTKSDR